MTDEPELRKDSEFGGEFHEFKVFHPEPPNDSAPEFDDQVADLASVQPKFGFRSAFAFVSIGCVQVLMIDYAEDLSEITTMLWLASIWSGWANCIWLLIGQPITMLRAFMLSGAFGWHCMLFTIGREQLPERYVILLGFFGLLLSTAIIILNLPTFTMPGEKPTLAKRRTFQFSILTVSLLTTGLAVIMFAGKRYWEVSNIEFFQANSITMVLLAAVVVLSIFLSSSSGSALLGIICVLLASMLSATVMVIAEHWLLTSATRILQADTWGIYTSVVCLMGIAIYTFGRLAIADAQSTIANATNPDPM